MKKSFTLIELLVNTACLSGKCQISPFYTVKTYLLSGHHPQRIQLFSAGAISFDSCQLPPVSWPCCDLICFLQNRCYIKLYT